MFGTDTYIAANSLELVDSASADEISGPDKILCINLAVTVIRISAAEYGKRLELV